MKNKLLSLGLCTALLVSLLPLYALADDEETVEEPAMTETETYSTADEEEDFYSTTESKINLEDGEDVSDFIDKGDDSDPSDNEPTDIPDDSDNGIMVLGAYDDAIPLTEGVPVTVDQEGMIYSFNPAESGLYSIHTTNDCMVKLYRDDGGEYMWSYTPWELPMVSGGMYYLDPTSNGFNGTFEMTVTKTAEPIELVLDQEYSIDIHEDILYSYTSSESGFYTFTGLNWQTSIDLWDENGELYTSCILYITTYLNEGSTYYWQVKNESYSDADTLTLSKVDGLRHFNKTADADTANSGDVIGFTMTAQVIPLFEDAGRGGSSGGSIRPFSESDTDDGTDKKWTAVAPYCLTFHDVLDEGLELDETSITVIYHRNQLDGATAERKDIVLPDDPGLYFIDMSASDGCSYEVEIDLYAMSNTLMDSSDECYIYDMDELEYSVFEILYSAQLSEDVTPGIYYNTGSAIADFYGSSNSSYEVTPIYPVYAFTERSEKVVTPITTYGIEVYKYDSQTQAVLPGAGFELTDPDGHVVETLTTDGNGFAGCGTYADGREFILTETVTPEGYITKADSVKIMISEETTTDFIYTVRVENEPEDGEKPDDEKPDDGKPDDGKPDDEKPDDEKPDNGEPDDEHPEIMGGNVGGPKTGDTNHMGIWLLLFIVSLVCGSVVFYIRRKI